MKDYIVKLTRNIGIGSDIANYLEKRGCEIVYSNPNILPKTVIVRTELNHTELSCLAYVDNVVEAVDGRLDV